MESKLFLELIGSGRYVFFDSKFEFELSTKLGREGLLVGGFLDSPSKLYAISLRDVVVKNLNIDLGPNRLLH